MNKSMLKRILIYVIGIFVLALGLVLNTKAKLGVSPIISSAYAASFSVPFSLGTCTTILYCILIVVEICLYRKLDLMTLLQLPFSFAFGYIIDFYNVLIKIENPSLIVSAVVLLIAIVCTAAGAFMMVNMQLIVNPGDGYVNAFSKVLDKPFGKVKLVSDICMVCITCILSFVLYGKIVGVGVGTLVAAMLTGTCISYYDHLFGRKLAEIVIESKKA